MHPNMYKVHLYTVELQDSEGNTLKETEVKTNGFGSASGSFALPKGLRNGYFSLSVRRSGSTSLLERDSFRVDEFVLPTFDLSFDNDDHLYLVGDEVPVSGKITSTYNNTSCATTSLSRPVESMNRMRSSSFASGSSGRICAKSSGMITNP